jgi:hypothetical protein
MESIIGYTMEKNNRLLKYLSNAACDIPLSLYLSFHSPMQILSIVNKTEIATVYLPLKGNNFL